MSYLIPNLNNLTMLYILSFLFAFAVLYFLVYEESNKDLATTISKNENSFELIESEIHQTTPMLNFKSFIIPDELGFLMDAENNIPN